MFKAWRSYRAISLSTIFNFNNDRIAIYFRLFFDTVNLHLPHLQPRVAITSRYSASTLVVSPPALLCADHRLTSSLRSFSCPFTSRNSPPKLGIQALKWVSESHEARVFPSWDSLGQEGWTRHQENAAKPPLKRCGWGGQFGENSGAPADHPVFS